MNYKLKFLPIALKEWKKLDNTIQIQLKKKLKERLKNPHIYTSQLFGFQNHYKIKLSSKVYRLVYEVIDKEICVLIIAIAKRSKNKIYKHVKKRIFK